MSRAEYMREYRKKQQQKKHEDYKKQLEDTIQNNPWFDPNTNFYLNPILYTDLKTWHDENEKRFYLQCRIDGKIPTKQMYNDFTWEKDLKDRCIKYRLFCKSFYKKTGEMPWYEMCVLNEVFKPDLSQRPDLLPLLIPQPDDPDIIVITCDDWAAQDNFEYYLKKLGHNLEDYETFLGNRKTSDETRKEYVTLHNINPEDIPYIYTYHMKDGEFLDP